MRILEALYTPAVWLFSFVNGVYFLIYAPAIYRYCRDEFGWQLPSQLKGSYNLWFSPRKNSFLNRLFLLVFFLGLWLASWILSFALRP